MNVLFITADQFRGDSLSCAGHPTVRTPVLDRLAAEGVRFARHHANGIPCGPSRASLLTGTYQMNHRSVRNGTPIDAAFTNLAECVRTVGCDPWLIGYTDTSLDPRRYHPRDPRVGRYEEILPGFSQFVPGSELGTGDRAWRAWLRSLGYPNWDDPYRQEPLASGIDRGPTHAPISIRAQHSDTAFATDNALRFFEHNRDRPWFLHLSYLRPHPPLVAPEPWNAMYHPDDVPDFVALPSLEAERALHPFMPYRLARLEQSPALPCDVPPNENLAWRQARATYYGLISELDQQLGRLFDALRAMGMYDRTLIVFTSDHGEMLGDHWCWGKEVPFDKAVHVPLIVHSPLMASSAKGRVVDLFTEHVDVMPTILEHLGAEIPLQCDGHSLRPFLDGDTPGKWRSFARWEYDFRNVETGAPERELGISLDECTMSVVRTIDAKYVHFAALPPLYFDLANDPGELVDLAADPARSVDILKAAQLMLDWRLVYNRRELTGFILTEGRQMEADRSRRVRGAADDTPASAEGEPRRIDATDPASLADESRPAARGVF